MYKFVILLLCVLLNVCGASGVADNQTAKYGEKISFAGGREIKFSDFSIKFTGKREVAYPNENSPRKMTFYDFEAVKADEKQKISWSSGTGDVAPTFFEIGGGSYVLELGQSDVIGSLGENNLVVWRKSDYEKAAGKKN